MFTRKLSSICSISLALGERGGGRTLNLRSVGFLTFGIRPRPRSSMVDLRLVDAEARIEPFTVEIDKRSIKIEGFVLTRDDFEMSACTGEVDQTTKDGSFTLAFTLTSSHIPVLRDLADLGDRGVRIEILERGKVDLARGRIIETHADAFEIPSGIPRTLLAGAGRSQARNSKDSCAVETVKLAGLVSDEFEQSDLDRREWGLDMIVCPGTKITLVWALQDVGAVKAVHILEKKSGAKIPCPLNANGVGTVEQTPTSDSEYELVVEDPSCAPNSDTVRVWIVKPGQEIKIGAKPAYNGTAYWDGNPKLIGKGVFATSIRSVECQVIVNPPVPNWDYEFTDMDGRVSYGTVESKYTPTTGDLPLHGCHWVFTPTYVVRDALGWCFMIRCACH